MTVTKTAEDAIQALREVARGREDFVYRNSDDYEMTQSCVNWTRVNSTEDSPGGWHASCIVGHVLTLWGFPEGQKVSCESAGIGAVRDELQDLADRGHPDALFVLDGEALRVLGAAQNVQDDETARTWGDALRAAEWQAQNPDLPVLANPVRTELISPDC